MKDITFKNLTDEQINAIKILKSLTDEQVNAIKILIGDTETETQKEEEKVSFPQPGDKYYFIYSDGSIGEDYYIMNYNDGRVSLGNCFKTREEAEFEVERRKVIHEMKKFAEPEDFEWDNFNYHDYLYYDILCDRILIGSSRCSRCTGIFFKTRDDVKDCIKAVGEDRIKKYYFGVKEEDKE